MGHFVDSDERGTGELILFALGFIGFVIAVCSIVVASLGGTVLGGGLLLFSVACFTGSSSDRT